MKQTKTARASAQCWIDVAVKALSDDGPDALTIDALCQKTEKTKGSFYAHFDSYDAFLAALAAYWQESNTDAVMCAVEREASLGDRLALLNHLAVRLDAKLDLGMRRLADRSQHIREAVAETDRARISYLARLYQAVENCSAQEASDLATIEYAAYVGLQRIDPAREPYEFERLYRVFVRLTSQPMN